jgi:DNA polymerase eta
VLAVTYPAREYGVKRGDSWEAVASKSNNQCIAIHLPILEIGNDEDNGNKFDKMEEEEDDDSDTLQDGTVDSNMDQEAFDKEFHLSPEERQQCIQNENGVRRYHYQGKASLERYRLASRVIFTNVLESLRRRVGKGFILEKASIDEFYLDLTDYCYGDSEGKSEDDADKDSGFQKTKVVGGQEHELGETILDMDNADDVEVALLRACQTSAWIRRDIWEKLGFTMSAGISTNKMMAKLTASFGKPNGQAVLYPKNFSKLMAETKVRKVRNFGGKLGKRVLELLRSHTGSEQSLEDFSSAATMIELAKVPLPVLQHAFSAETSQFVFQACQGIDNEPVNETSGALVKSITAFKSFTANKNQGEVLTWLKLLAKEIAERVAQDSARNHRYPKTCTLNYTYYTTADGKRPQDRMSARTQRQSRSYRLAFPAERESIAAKSESLVEQAMAKLGPILKEHPLRGVGLAASNFESRGQPPQGNTSIESFFSVGAANKKVPVKDADYKIETVVEHEAAATATVKKKQKMDCDGSVAEALSAKEETTLPSHAPKQKPLVVDSDLAMAKKLQASFDRENYVFSKLNSRRGEGANTNSKPKTNRIDSFFTKRR